MPNCFNCNDMGMPDGCPVCGTTEKKIKIIVPDVIYDKLNYIPEAYRAAWDDDILKKDHLNYENDSEFIKYVDTLNKLVGTLQSGKLPRQSAMILSSIGMGKTHLAYYCMAIANTHGFKIAPIIDNIEYRRLNALSTDGYLARQYSQRNPTLPTIDEIVNSDIQFMYIDPTAWKDAHRDIQSLVFKRDRRGKPTIILSHLTVNQISATDQYDREFSNMLTSGNMSIQKQLRIVQCFLR